MMATTEVAMDVVVYRCRYCLSVRRAFGAPCYQHSPPHLHRNLDLSSGGSSGGSGSSGGGSGVCGMIVTTTVAVVAILLVMARSWLV
jgi:hypothetical protein